MKYCGVVTDRSWLACQPNPTTSFDSITYYNYHQHKRIYSDEVELADGKTIEYFKMSNIGKWAYRLMCSSKEDYSV